VANSHHVVRQSSYIVKSSLDLRCEQGTHDNRKAPFSHIHICKSFLEPFSPQEEKKTSEPGWGGYGGGRVSTRAEVQMGTNRQKPNHVLTVLEYRIDLIKSQ
jgi:hypothetical protein